MSRLEAWCASALVALCCGCGAAGAANPSGTLDWRHEVGAAHPLVGKVWDVEAGQFISMAQLEQQVSSARWLLLGEKHDNADHHRLQAALLKAWLRDGEGRAVGFEMLDENQQARVDQSERSPSALATAVAWDDSGWPAFEYYAPIFEALLPSAARVVAAHPPRATVRAGLDPVPAERRAELGLDQPLPPALREALEKEIEEGHCGHSSESMVAYMVGAQRLKDAWMAEAMRKAAGPGGVALVAGWGHVRRDRGVPYYLRDTEGRLVSVAMLEVEKGRQQPGQVPMLSRSGVFDYVVFTPRVDDVDACTKFRRQLERMRAHKSQRNK